MTSPFPTATLAYASGRVEFQGETSLTMPFPGALVIPRPAGETPAAASLTAAASAFVGVRHPRTGPAGARRFPHLRTMDGSVLDVTGPVLVMMAEDPGVFDEFDLGNVFSEGDVLTPQFPELGALTSCRPKYLVLVFDAGTTLIDADPRLVDDGSDLTQLDGFTQSSLSGTLMAFDHAGLEVEADAALATLGLANVPGAPSDPNQVRVQLVDVLGASLADEAIATLRAMAGSADADVDFEAHDLPRRLHRVTFPDQNRSLKVAEQATIPVAVPADQRYLWRGARAAIWPGRDAKLQPLADVAEFDLGSGVPSGQDPPGFVRICVYHPAQTMQTAYSGALDDDGVFSQPNPIDASPASGMALEREADSVTVFNDGAAYFRDVADALEAAGAGDRLYVTNWTTDVHLHMRGTLRRMGLGPIDVDRGDVDEVLAAIDQNRIVLPAGDGETDFLVFPDRLDRGAAIPAGLAYEVRRVPTPGVADKALSEGFFRPDGVAGFALVGDLGTPFESRIIARWKDPADGVHETQRILDSTVGPIAGLPAIPETAFALGITADDPPSGTVIRTATLPELGQALNEATASLRLLVVNATTGRHVVLDVTHVPNGSDAVLGGLPEDTRATDEVHLVVLRGEPGPTDLLADVVASRARRFRYTAAQHVSGAIPLAGDELGGLLRRAIADDVEVRALYWDQFLANLTGGEALASGHSDNQEMTALLNLERNGKRGFAVRDRSTRAFGSFHQKGVVLVRGSNEITAWLGGIDLALGRWDSSEHPEADPDRQGGKWWDAQIRLTGPAAFDVLRNFAQRWWAVGAFIDGAALSPNEFAGCLPVEAPPAVAADLQTEVELPVESQLVRPLDPAASVQITRTCPPRSCHSKIAPPPAGPGVLEPQGQIAQAGELGSLAAYLKAIGAARRFVLMNDQYFFSPEIALALHEALSRDDGPSFVVLMLPKDLSEHPLVDPMLFKVRQKSLHILLHGGTWTAPSVPPGQLDDSFRFAHCGGVTANPAVSTSPLANRVAVVHARNQEDKKVYVHSKHMIVDDVWMSIGSANLNYRSSTYDFEINASVVGSKLDFGGTDVVRRQRVELARQMMGLPAAFAPLISDPEVMFAQFKALEAKSDSPEHDLHPREPMCQQLDPAYVKKVGDAAFDGNVDAVSALDMNHSAIDGIACSVIDPDGREDKEAVAPFAGFVTNAAQAYRELTLTVGCQTLTEGLLSGGVDLFAEILVTEGAGMPRRVQRIELTLGGGTVVPSPAVGDIWVPISTQEVTVIEARVIDAADVERGCQAIHTIEPNVEIVVAGSIEALSMTMS